MTRTLEENKEIIRRWIDAGVNTGDLSVADELFEPDVLAHAPEGEVRGVDKGPKASVRLLREALPDLELTIDDLIAEGDRVVARFVARGSHRGEFMGIPPRAFRVLQRDVRLPVIERANRGGMGQPGCARALRPARGLTVNRPERSVEAIDGGLSGCYTEMSLFLKNC